MRLGWVILGSALCLLGGCGQSKSPSTTDGDSDGIADATADGERRNAGDGPTDMADATTTADSSPDASMGAGDAADAGADAVDVADAIGERDDATDAGDSIGDATGGSDALRALRPVHVVTGTSGGVGHDIRFIGSGLDAYEGHVVLVRVDYPDAVHTHGWGEARIIGGAFDLLLPGALVMNFNPKGAVIDVNDDERCSVGEPAYFIYTASVGDLTVRLTPDKFTPVVSCDYLNSFPGF